MLHIADLLSHGPENGITLRHLEKLSDLPGREVRRQIERERRAGALIISDNQHGYYLTDNPAEAQRFARSMQHRAWEILRTARAIEGAAGLTDVFRECRERVSAQDVARHYGLTFDRKGWALCPFHLNEDLGKLIDAPLEAFSIVEKIRALEAECYCERKLTKWRKSKKNTQAGSK